MPWRKQLGPETFCQTSSTNSHWKQGTRLPTTQASNTAEQLQLSLKHTSRTGLALSAFHMPFILCSTKEIQRLVQTRLTLPLPTHSWTPLRAFRITAFLGGRQWRGEEGDTKAQQILLKWQKKIYMHVTLRVTYEPIQQCRQGTPA